METHTLSSQPLLRQKAESRMQEKKYKLSPDTSMADLLTLSHELLVHQIELEEQNEELIKARDRAEMMSEKYLDLYDLAPIGYFTLNKKGEIVEANLYAASILGKKHDSLLGSRFGFFVTEVSKPVYSQFIADLILTRAPATCVISLDIFEDQNTHALLSGHVTRDGKHCLIAVIDIGA